MIPRPRQITRPDLSEAASDIPIRAQRIDPAWRCGVEVDHRSAGSPQRSGCLSVEIEAHPGHRSGGGTSRVEILMRHDPVAETGRKNPIELEPITQEQRIDRTDC